MTSTIKQFEKALRAGPTELHPDLVGFVTKSDGKQFAMLRHPLIYSVPYFEQMNAVLNMQYVARDKAVKKAWSKREWEKYVFLHEKPYRVQALGELLQVKIDARKYFAILADVWTSIENTWQTSDAGWERLWKGPKGATSADRRVVMTREERDRLHNMPPVITVYRGTSGLNPMGWSWTTSLKTAEWFASRFSSKTPIVFVARVNTSEVLAYFEGRSESEIVVNPKSLWGFTVHRS